MGSVALQRELRRPCWEGTHPGAFEEGEASSCRVKCGSEKWKPAVSVSCKGPPPQTVRKLLEQRRQQQAALSHSTAPLIPPGALEASWPEPHGTIEKGVSTLGQSTVPQYPVAAFPAWQPDASSQGAFSPDFHYPGVDPGNNFHLQPQGSQYDVMSPCPPLETNIYGAAGPGGPGEVYTSKITSAVNYEKVATEAVHLYPSSETPWLGQEQSNACLLLPGSYADLSVDVDPGELTQARAEIQNIDLSHLLQQDEDGDMLLHLFVAQDVNAMDQKGQTVLHLGATYGLPSVIETQNMEPLSQHHLQHLLLCIQRLLQLGADYKSQAHGNTALHMAAGLHGHPYQEQIVRLLLDHWADPTARNPENEQPVHLLTSGPAAEQLRLLLRSRRSGPGSTYIALGLAF
ncbi:NF-kappa-B inhibitor delta, partial [Ophiophagus hannah]